MIWCVMCCIVITISIFAKRKWSNADVICCINSRCCHYTAHVVIKQHMLSLQWQHVLFKMLSLRVRGGWDSKCSMKWSSESLHSRCCLEMLKEMVIEILNGGETLVNCKFKLNKNLTLNLYHEIPRNSNPIKNLNSTTLYREILRYRFFTIWLKSPHHWGLGWPFHWAFRVSSSTQRVVLTSAVLRCIDFCCIVLVHLL